MPETDPRQRVTTPLLTLITQQSLDEDYRHVSERRAAEEEGGGVDGLPRPRARSHGTAALVLAAFGVLVAIAAVQTSRSAETTDASRATLIGQIQTGRDNLARLEQRMDQLRELDVALQERVARLGAEQQEAEARLTRLRSTTGFGAVSGPGVRITVDDAPDGSAAVRDIYLRPLVNGLWEAGAEAIAINGQRLTQRTAIRNSSVAIHVNVRPLSPPYVVSAIGDPRTLAARLMETQSGLDFRSIAQHFGFPVSMENEDSLNLPAAPSKMSRLRYAVDSTVAQPNKHQKEGTP